MGPQGAGMTKRTRNIVLIACGLASAGSFAVFVATGMYPYTRFKSEETAAVNAETSLTAMFDDTGLDEGEGEMEQVANVTAIGFLPSGPGRASISVMSITGPALVVAGVVILVSRRQAKNKQSA
jgi:hypothetical protein